MATQGINDGSMHIASSSLQGTNRTYQPTGDTWRGIFGDWFNGNNIADEDWQRNEQSADNQLWRDMYKFEYEKDFAREQRSWEEMMANTSYQRAVADMKKAGINPVMAVSQGGASTPSAGSVSSGSSSSSNRSGGSSFNTTGLLTSILSIVAGLYTKGASNATALAIAKMTGESSSSRDAMNLFRDDQWRNFYRSQPKRK